MKKLFNKNNFNEKNSLIIFFSFLKKNKDFNKKIAKYKIFFREKIKF